MTLNTAEINCLQLVNYKTLLHYSCEMALTLVKS